MTDTAAAPEATAGHAVPHQPRHGAGFSNDGRPTPVGQLLRDTWRARSLVAVLARKDFYVRYRRATFGLLWAAVLPLIQALALSFVVSRFARFETGSDYAVFVLAGTVPWTTFSGTVAAGSTAVADGAGLATKIYFPRLVLPLVTVWTSAYGFAISIATLLAACVVSGVGLGLRTFLLVPAAALTLLLAGSFALVLSALHVYFRDVRYLVQAAVLVWMYLTPVIYPLRAIGGARPWIEANPVTGIVELSRAATVGADAGWETALLWTVAWCAVLLVAAVALHRRFDRVFVDLL